MCLSLEVQLKDLLENHDVHDDIINTANRIEKHNDNYEDLFDGELYKASMPMADCSRLSLTFNSDGVPVFRSSSCSIWPVLCTVNELSPRLRKDHVK